MTLETDLPLPTREGGTNNKYDFYKLTEPGYSMSYPAPDDLAVQRVRIAASRYAARNSINLTSSIVYENDERRIRVWRTETPEL